MWKVRDQVNKHHMECPEFDNIGEPEIMCCCDALDAIIERYKQKLSKQAADQGTPLYL